jgi:hypothetical protein
MPKELADLDAGWGEDESGVSERPTVAPPFDLESYAKENAVGSASHPGIAGPGRAPLGAGSGRSMEDRIDDLLQESAAQPQEAAMRAPSDTALTMPPPAALPGQSAGPPSDPLSRRETPQGVQQIEAARAMSAREDLGTGTLLSLANMRVPSNLPPRGDTPRTPGPRGDTPQTSGPRVPGFKRAEDDPVITLVENEGDEGDTESEAGFSGDPHKEMQERFALGDYSGALVMAEALLEENPTHVEAREYAESCRAVLQQMYTAKIGPLDRVPVVEVAREQLRWLSIDHRAGFVLSLVDGVSSLEMILDVSGMPSLDALRILYELVQQRIVSIRED